jgi:hypothetical protein
MENIENNKSCLVCGNPASAYLRISSSASRVIWWNKQLFRGNACAICAEQIYLHNQKRNGRQGWWGPISFLYTIYALIRNRFAIQTHRKLLPTIEHEGVTYARPEFKITRDVPTIALTLLALSVVVGIVLSVNESVRPITRDNFGQVTEVKFVSMDELRLGDCVTAAPEELTSQLEVTACADEHRWQVFGIGSSTLVSYDDSGSARDADEVCGSFAARVNMDKLEQQQFEMEAMHYSPTALSWSKGDRRVVCLIGSGSQLFTGDLLN